VLQLILCGRATCRKQGSAGQPPGDKRASRQAGAELAIDKCDIVQYSACLLM